MALPISFLARTTVLGFLSSLFNDALADNCSLFGATPFTINFATNSPTFFQGYYAAKDIIATSSITFPMMTLYSTRSQNQNLDKYNIFSGPVEIGIDTFVSFPQSRALSNTELLIDAVESTMYGMFNTPANQSLWGSTYYSVTHAGYISVQRGPLSPNGPNWLQLVQTRLELQVNAVAPVESI